MFNEYNIEGHIILYYKYACIHLWITIRILESFKQFDYPFENASW